MSITIGTRLGSHEITGLLGKGGMGEVYRARDAKLKREVAIKFLPEEFLSDSDRTNRFQREAELLASLNHPNIGAIYDLEEADGSLFLVLELVEGETLAERIARGSIPLEEGLDIAKQICDALEAAHERGIIHRDLKPANIKITPDGTVKVLDFGLAKPTGAESSDVEGLSNSPTLRTLASSPGMILGTAAYMSPEQAKGRPIDRRTDIFAFGCVLYEMLTGKRAFEGEDMSDTLAAVLRAEPVWDALPQDLPSAVRTLIQQCLVKDRAKRVPDMSVPKFLLTTPAFIDISGEPPATAEPASARSKTRAAVLITATLLFVAAAAGALVWMLRPSSRPPSVVRFSIALPAGQRLSSSTHTNIAISPDGTRLVYAANSRLYLRSLSAFESVAVPGSEGKGNPTNLPFSRDGRWIAFWSDLISKRIAVDVGTPLPIVPASAARTSFDWGSEGIVFAQGAQGIHRIAVNGGTPQQLVTVKDEGAFNPHLLPGGEAVLFTQTKVTGDARWDTAQIVLQALKSGERKTLVDGTVARYLPTGHLLYAVGGTVFAAPFDLKKQKITGEAVPVIEGVRRASRTGQSDLSVSDTGTLIYVPGSATPSSLSRRLIVMDRSGSVTPLPLPSGPYSHPRVSRDGKHAAVAIDDGQNAYVSVFELPAAATLRRLTFEGHNRFPVWSGDSQSIAFQSERDADSGIFIQRADGSSPRAERLTKADAGTEHVPEAWSPDGKTLLFSAKTNGLFSLLMFSFESRQISAFGNVQSRNPISASFSPDGHWIAYSSFGSGR